MCLFVYKLFFFFFLNYCFCSCVRAKTWIFFQNDFFFSGAKNAKVCDLEKKNIYIYISRVCCFDRVSCSLGNPLYKRKIKLSIDLDSFCSWFCFSCLSLFYIDVSAVNNFNFNDNFSLSDLVFSCSVLHSVTCAVLLTSFFFFSLSVSVFSQGIPANHYARPADVRQRPPKKPSLSDLIKHTALDKCLSVSSYLSWCLFCLLGILLDLCQKKKKIQLSLSPL